MINDKYLESENLLADYYKDEWEKIDEQAANNSRDQERQVQGCACSQPVKTYCEDDANKG